MKEENKLWISVDQVDDEIGPNKKKEKATCSDIH
jgi:hypothetical protein